MRILALFVTSILLLSCSSLPVPIPDSTSKYVQTYRSPLQSCAQQLIDFKRTVQQQGVQDAQLLWIPRYPHLAFDRFSLSLIPELKSYQARAQWLNYVTRQATIQRKVEYQNLPDKSTVEYESQEYCANKLAALNDENFWRRLQQSPPTYPSDYQNWQRIVGLYPLSSLLVEPSIHSEKKRILRGFHQPLHDYSVSYGVNDKPTFSQQEVQTWIEQATGKSSLEWPQLTDIQLTRLLEFHAPEFLIESVSLDDKPGRAEYHGNGQPQVAPHQPVLYVSHSFTHFHGKVLLQLNYSLWFANRTAKSTLDPYAGQFDGILFRLTLDSHGQPYILDSIHHCGCYHMVFALDPQLKFAARNPNIEAPITLQVYPNIKAKTLNITLSDGEHMIKGVRWTKGNDQVRPLTVLDYHQLRSLPVQNGKQKSLFDQQGMLTASERLERFYLWPFGVRSPGAMRQIGHHAIAFIGERHFDDPTMLEALFLSP